MSAQGKRRLVYAGLWAFTLWPVLHMYLVTHDGLSAWKLAGWGMYATPRPSFAAMALQARRPGAKGFAEIRSVSDDCRKEANRFLERQRWLGQLVRPDELARLLRKRTPQFADWRIIVDVPVLDRRSGMIVEKRVVYDYPGIE